MCSVRLGEGKELPPLPNPPQIHFLPTFLEAESNVPKPAWRLGRGQRRRPLDCKLQGKPRLVRHPDRWGRERSGWSQAGFMHLPREPRGPSALVGSCRGGRSEDPRHSARRRTERLGRGAGLGRQKGQRGSDRAREAEDKHSQACQTLGPQRLCLHPGDPRTGAHAARGGGSLPEAGP